jgi:hypothetical protein
VKSCLDPCSWAANIEDLGPDCGGKRWTCSVPLPPWRFRHGDELCEDTHFCYGKDGKQAKIASGDAIAEHCHWYARKT